MQQDLVLAYPTASIKLSVGSLVPNENKPAERTTHTHTHTCTDAHTQTHNKTKQNPKHSSDVLFQPQ